MMIDSERSNGSHKSSVWVYEVRALKHSRRGAALDIWIRNEDTGEQSCALSLTRHAGSLSSTTADERLDIRQGFIDLLGDADVKELVAILSG